MKIDVIYALREHNNAGLFVYGDQVYFMMGSNNFLIQLSSIQ